MKRVMLSVPADAGQPVQPMRLPLLEYRAQRRIRTIVGDPLATRTKIAGVRRDYEAAPYAFFSPHGFSDGASPNVRASRLVRHSVWGDAVVLAVLFDGWYGDSLAGLSPEMAEYLTALMDEAAQ